MERSAFRCVCLAVSLASLTVAAPALGQAASAEALESTEGLETAEAPESARALEEKVRGLERQVAELRSAGAADPGRIEELERRIEILAREIETLKLGEAAPSAGPGVHGLGPAASKVYATREGVSVGGYGEALYENFASEREDGAPSGATDRLDFVRAVLYVGYKYGDRIVFNSEIEFEHATTGEGAAERGEVSVEFAYLDFLLREAINVRAGMVLVPMGFVNELHEPPVFLGTRRPLVEQRLIPTTWRENGAGVFGEAGSLAWRAYLVAGLAGGAGSSSGAQGFSASGIRGGRSSGSQSAAEDFAVVGRLDWRVTPAMGVGASAYSGGAGQGLRTGTGETIDARTTILEGHVEWRWRGLETRALYLRTAIDDVAALNAAQGFAGAESVGERQRGWYGQLGWDVLAGHEGGQALIPFARYERLDTQARVPEGFAADPANDVTVTTLGATWKPIENVAVKADYSRIDNEARTGLDQLNVALGFLF